MCPDLLDHLKATDYCLRFYEDGTVVSVSLEKNTDLKEVAKWFNKNHSYSSKGKYTSEGTKLNFFTTSVSHPGSEIREVTVDYLGTIEGGGMILALETYSHFNGNRDKRQYRFIEMKLSEP